MYLGKSQRTARGELKKEFRLKALFLQEVKPMVKDVAVKNFILRERAVYI